MIDLAFPDWTGGNLCTALIVVLILTVLGGKMVEDKAVLRRLGFSLAALVFVGLFAWGAVERKPESAPDCLPIVLSALAFSGMALGFAWIVLPILAWVLWALIVLPLTTIRQWGQAIGQASTRQRKQWAEELQRRQQRVQQERERSLRAEQAKAWVEQEPERRQQEAEAARKRYEHRLRMLEKAGLEPIELEAARAQAKQEYLRELDRVLK